MGEGPEEPQSPQVTNPREHLLVLLEKTARLKDFAVKNGFEVDPATIRSLNELLYKYGQTEPSGQPESQKNQVEDSSKLDAVIAKLTAVTFPTTIDLPVGNESPEYERFKGWLWKIAVCGLFFAVAGFVASVLNIGVNGGWVLVVGNSVLAISLGLLGAVTYSLFNVLRVIPPQAFNPKDEYNNYARLLLGALLGWVFYFVVAMNEFRNLHCYLVRTDPKTDPAALKLLIPFIAGYSTKFVVGLLERSMEALEVALSIEEKRDIRAKRVLSRRGSQ